MSARFRGWRPAPRAVARRLIATSLPRRSRYAGPTWARATTTKGKGSAARRAPRPPRRSAAGASHGLHDQRCVGAAEAEAVVEHSLDLALLGLVRDEVDAGAAVRRIVEVERRRDDLVAHGEDAEDALDRAGAAKQMAD